MYTDDQKKAGHLLREKTGHGMMDCCKAMIECDNDLDKAAEWLRTRKQYAFVQHTRG